MSASAQGENPKTLLEEDTKEMLKGRNISDEGYQSADERKSSEVTAQNTLVDEGVTRYKSSPANLLQNFHDCDENYDDLVVVRRSRAPQDGEDAISVEDFLARKAAKENARRNTSPRYAGQRIPRCLTPTPPLTETPRKKSATTPRKKAAIADGSRTSESSPGAIKQLSFQTNSSVGCPKQVLASPSRSPSITPRASLSGSYENVSWSYTNGMLSTSTNLAGNSLARSSTTANLIPIAKRNTLLDSGDYPVDRIASARDFYTTQRTASVVSCLSESAVFEKTVSQKALLGGEHSDTGRETTFSCGDDDGDIYHSKGTTSNAVSRTSSATKPLYTSGGKRIFYVEDRRNKLVRITHVNPGDLFRQGDMLEVIFQRDEWYVGRHVVKETEYTFLRRQCEIVTDIQENQIMEMPERKKHQGYLKAKIEQAKRDHIMPTTRALSAVPSGSVASGSAALRSAHSAAERTTSARPRLTSVRDESPALMINSEPQPRERGNSHGYNAAASRAAKRALGYDNSSAQQKADNYEDERHSSQYESSTYDNRVHTTAQAPQYAGSIYTSVPAPPAPAYCTPRYSQKSPGSVFQYKSPSYGANGPSAEYGKGSSAFAYPATLPSAATLTSNYAYPATGTGAAGCPYNYYPVAAWSGDMYGLYTQTSPAGVYTSPYASAAATAGYPYHAAASTPSALHHGIHAQAIAAQQASAAHQVSAALLTSSSSNGAGPAAVMTSSKIPGYSGNGVEPSRQESGMSETKTEEVQQMPFDPNFSVEGYNKYQIPLGDVQRGQKFLCTYMVGIMDEQPFCVVRKIIGPVGKHMKNIASIIPGGKVRLRGRGSGFQERDTGVESHDPLQINVSMPNREGYLVAKHILTSLLQNIYNEYYKFTGRRIELRLLEHPRNPQVDPEWMAEFRAGNPIFALKRPYEAEAEPLPNRPTRKGRGKSKGKFQQVNMYGYEEA